MIVSPDLDKSIVTVSGVQYVIKIAVATHFAANPKEMSWYVVAFARDLDWRRHVPLAGPFESKAKAAAALETYLNQPSFFKVTSDQIARATARG